MRKVVIHVVNRNRRSCSHSKLTNIPSIDLVKELLYRAGRLKARQQGS